MQSATELERKGRSDGIMDGGRKVPTKAGRQVGREVRGTEGRRREGGGRARRCEHARFCVEVFYALYINFHSFIHSRWELRLTGWNLNRYSC